MSDPVTVVVLVHVDKDRQATDRLCSYMPGGHGQPLAVSHCVLCLPGGSLSWESASYLGLGQGWCPVLYFRFWSLNVRKPYLQEDSF